VLIAGAVLLAVVYFVVTSGAFLKAVALPRVSQAINGRLTAGEVSLSPFSQLALRRVKLETTGAEPLFQADEVRVRYRLFGLLGGKVDLPEVVLAGPRLNVVQQADGSSNLDPLLRTRAAKPTRPGKPLQIDLQKLSLSKGLLRFTKLAKDGASDSSEVANLGVTVSQVKNGQAGKLTLGADLMQTSRPPPKATNQAAVIRARASGALDFALDAQLLPASLKGDVRFAVGEAQGSFRELGGLSGVLACDVSPTEIRQATLRFERAGARLGQLQVSGPLELAKSEGRLKLEVSAIDRNVLNLFGAAHGLDFANTTINASALVDFSRKGELIGGRGKASVAQFGLRQKDAATPPVDASLDYQFTVNLAEKTAVLQSLSLQARQPRAELLSAALDRPMNFSWGENVHGLNEASVKLALKELNLADWQMLFGTNMLTGQVSVEGTVNSQQDGRRLSVSLTGKGQNLNASVGTNRFELAAIQAELRGQCADFKRVTLDSFKVEVLQRGKPLAAASGSGGYNLDTGAASLQAALNADLPALLQQYPLPQVAATAGRVDLSVLLAQASSKRTVNAKLTLDKFAGEVAGYRLADYQLTLDADSELKDREVNLRRASLSLRHGLESGGALDVSGRFDLSKRAGDFTFGVVNLNEHALGPFLGPALAPAALASVALNLTGTAHYDARGESALQCQSDLKQLVLTDPEHKLPKAPVNARLQLEVAQRQDLVELRRLLLALEPRTQGTNELELRGKLNLTNRVGEFTLAVRDLNEQALAPLLASALAPNRLASVSLNCAGSGRFDPKGAGNLQLGLQVSRLLLADAAGKLPATPLQASFELEAAQQQTQLELKKFKVSLPPTDRARNQLQAQGKLDFAASNAAPSRLSLTAESLDLTQLYDLFTTNRPAAAAQPAAAPPPAKPEVEPGPVKLPFPDLTAELKVERMFLREITIADWAATAKAARGEVSLSPCQFTLNGAPVSANASANLSQPGFAYALDLKADKVPLEPLANSFAPDKRGQLQGQLDGQAQVKGAGVTGASLQKNLQGSVNFSLTNLNLEVVSPKYKRLLTPVAVLLRVPELQDTPLNCIAARANLGGGKVDLQQFVATSPAFHATASGTIRLAEVLTNSPLDIPVQLALRRSLAEKARLVPAGAPTNTDYVQLPQFVKVAGTIGDPKTQTDKTKIAGLLAGSIGGAVGGDAGNVIQGVGGLLQGGNPLAPGTLTNLLPRLKPAPKTNAPPKLNPLDLLPGLLRPKR
jgi:type II secretion system protein N